MNLLHVRPGRFVGKFDPLGPTDQSAEECYDFRFGKIPADARVNAKAITEMTVWRAVWNEFEGRSKASSSRLPEG